MLGLLARTFVGFVPADEATGGGAEIAMVGGIVPGDAADQSAFDAAFRIGRSAHGKAHGKDRKKADGKRTHVVFLFG